MNRWARYQSDPRIQLNVIPAILPSTVATQKPSLSSLRPISNQGNVRGIAGSFGEANGEESKKPCSRKRLSTESRRSLKISGKSSALAFRYDTSDNAELT